MHSRQRQIMCALNEENAVVDEPTDIYTYVNIYICGWTGIKPVAQSWFLFE